MQLKYNLSSLNCLNHDTIVSILLSWFWITLLFMEKIFVLEHCSKMFRLTIRLCPYKDIVVFKGISTWNLSNSNSMQNRFYCALFENCCIRSLQYERGSFWVLISLWLQCVLRFWNNFLKRKYLLDFYDFWLNYYLDILVLSVNWNSFYEDIFMCKKIAENRICDSGFNWTFVSTKQVKIY